MSHGSKLYRNNGIKYKAQDLKVINKIWRETTNQNFKEDSKIPLEELIRIEIGEHAFNEAKKVTKIHSNNKPMYFVNAFGHELEIKRQFKELAYLALVHYDFNYLVEEDKMIIKSEYQ